MGCGALGPGKNAAGIKEEILATVSRFTEHRRTTTT